MKKPKSNKAKDKAPENPYLAAQAVWNDRLGTTVKSKRRWMMMAFLSLGLSIPSVFFALARSGQTKVIPYVVEVDNLGNVRGAGVAKKIPFKEEYIVEAAISTFMTNFRGVTVDGQLQQQRIESLYQYLAAGSAAYGKINSHFSGGNDPFDVAQKKTVSVRIVSINAVSGTSYNVEWRETDYDRTGLLKEERRYQGIVTYKILPPTKAAVIRTNPLGIYVVDVDISEIKNEN